MELSDFKKQAVEQVKLVVSRFSSGDIWQVSFDVITSNEIDKDENVTGLVDVTFTFGNCSKIHSIPVCWTVDDGFGLENADGEHSALTSQSILLSMYFDLALVNLNEKFLE